MGYAPGLNIKSNLIGELIDFADPIPKSFQGGSNASPTSAGTFKCHDNALKLRGCLSFSCVDDSKAREQSPTQDSTTGEGFSGFVGHRAYPFT